MYIAFICNDVYLDNEDESKMLLPGMHIDTVGFKEYEACREYVLARLDDFAIEMELDLDHPVSSEDVDIIPADMKDCCDEAYGYLTPEGKIKVIGMIIWQDKEK